MNIRISYTVFSIIFLLIFLIPVLLESQILLFGKSAEGKVVDYDWEASRSNKSPGYIYAIIQFKTENEVISVYGHQNVRYEEGEILKVMYDKEKPTDCTIVNWSYIYLKSGSTIIAGILLIFWAGIFYSLKQMEASQKHKPEENSGD